jgi:hypothetical protein
MKNMRWQLKTLGIDASQEDKVVHFKRFTELLKEKAISEDQLFSGFGNSPYYSKDEVMNIKNNYSKEKKAEMFSCMTFAWYQMLSELFPEKYSPYYITEIIAEVVSIHPDAAFPKKRMNDRVLLGDNKLFSLRLLAEAYEEACPNEIKEYYDTKGGIYDDDVSGQSIIWGYEELDKFIIKPESKAFWKKHEGAWWADNFSDKEKSINYPYECRRIRLILPIGWYPELSRETGAYDSVAYW